MSGEKSRRQSRDGIGLNLYLLVTELSNIGRLTVMLAILLVRGVRANGGQPGSRNPMDIEKTCWKHMHSKPCPICRLAEGIWEKGEELLEQQNAWRQQNDEDDELFEE